MICEMAKHIESLDEAVHRWAASISAMPDFRIEPPAASDVRMRSPVNRSPVRPVLKVASMKLGRVVQCESLLEADFALLLDVSPSVQTFAEQPVRIHYVVEGSWRTHIPDFVALSGGRLTFCEVKFATKVDAGASARTEHLRAVLATVGAGYRLLTERDIDRTKVRNAASVLRRARHANSEVRVLGALERLRTENSTNLGAFGWRQRGSLDGACAALLIAQGQANVDWSTELLNDGSKIWLADRSPHEEVLPWHPDH